MPSTWQLECDCASMELSLIVITHKTAFKTSSTYSFDQIVLHIPACEGAPLAGERPLLRVCAHVAAQLVLPGEHLAADLARGGAAVALLGTVLVGHVLPQVAPRGEQHAALAALHLLGRGGSYLTP